MATSYKRTIIQIPLKDVKLFEDYASFYGLSVSSAIISLAKKGLEQEQVIKYLPDIVSMYNYLKSDNSKSNKKVVKKKKSQKA